MDRAASGFVTRPRAFPLTTSPLGTPQTSGEEDTPPQALSRSVMTKNANRRCARSRVFIEIRVIMIFTSNFISVAQHVILANRKNPLLTT
jgi:hypothetical protein